MVDANMKWSADEAIRAARAFLAFELVWLEEPIIPDDIAGHARVVREGGMPIAAGENLRTLWEFKHLIASGGVTYPEPDVTNCGGVTAFMKVAHLAEAFNLPVTSHGAHDVTVHLLAACANRSYLEAHGFGLDRYLESPLVIDDGYAIAPERPGHGIAFDWAGLEKVEGDVNQADSCGWRARQLSSAFRADEAATSFAARATTRGGARRAYALHCHQRPTRQASAPYRP